VTHLFKEYAPAAGPTPTPFEAVDASDVVVFIMANSRDVTPRQRLE
jgi:hypothetical protein